MSIVCRNDIFLMAITLAIILEESSVVLASTAKSRTTANITTNTTTANITTSTTTANITTSTTTANITTSTNTANITTSTNTANIMTSTTTANIMTSTTTANTTTHGTVSARDTTLATGTVLQSSETSVMFQTCAPGRQLTNGSCQDINECNDLNVRAGCFGDCYDLTEGHICECVNGTVKRAVFRDFHANNAEFPTDPCVYLVPMMQEINSTAMNNISEDSLRMFFYEKLKKTLDPLRNWPDIMGVNITSLSRHSMVYEVQSTNITAVTATRIQNLYNQSLASGTWNVTGGRIAYSPRPAPLKCYPEVILSRSVLHRNFTFPRAEVGEMVFSLETCSEEGFSASVNCVMRPGIDGVSSGYFNMSNFKENYCKERPQEILIYINETNLTTSTVQYITDLLSYNSKQLSSNTSTDDVKSYLDAVDYLKEEVDKNNIEVSPASISNFLEFSDNVRDAALSSVEGGRKWLGSGQGLSMISALDMLTSHIVLDGDEVSHKSNSNSFLARKLNCSNPQKFAFDDVLPGQDYDRSVLSVIPASSIPKDCTTVNAIFLMHSDDTFFSAPLNTNLKVNQVLNSQLAGTKLQNLQDPVSLTFSQPPRGNGSAKEFLSHRCTYLDLETNEWNFSGCRTRVLNTQQTVCDCDHTTNFAVIVQTYPVVGSFALDVIGYVGCSISTLGLVLVVVIYTSYRKLRTNQIFQMHIHLSICLIVAYLTFMTGVQRPRRYVPCLIAAATLQLSLLSAWGWMVTECFTMYKKFVYVFGTMSSKYILKTSAIVYSLSTVTTALTMIVAVVTGDMVTYSGWESAADNDPDFHPSFYVSDRLCWLHGNSLYFGFLTPVAIMLLANIFGFIRISAAITTTNSTIRSSKTQKTELKDHALRVITVSVILGMSWAFAVPITLSDDTLVNEVFGWLFSISNSFQGLFIFLLFCVKRPDVRTLWTDSVVHLFGRNGSYDISGAHAFALPGNSATSAVKTLSSAATSQVTYSHLAESRGGTPVLDRKVEDVELSDQTAIKLNISSGNDTTEA